MGTDVFSTKANKAPAIFATNGQGFHIQGAIRSVKYKYR